MKIEINGEQREIDADGVESAVELIRDGLGLTGTKLVCGGGVCGACTVHLDGRPVASCLLPPSALDGRALTTVEGLGHAAPGQPGHPVQRALMAHDGLQCGFCTPGFVMAASAFHDRWRVAHAGERPSREQVAAGLAGHLCRCGAYEGITAAVQAACAGEFDEPGGASPRVEAAAKVTGAARYTVDVTVPGMLHGVIVRSERAHARVRRVDLPRRSPGPEPSQSTCSGTSAPSATRASRSPPSPPGARRRRGRPRAAWWSTTPTSRPRSTPTPRRPGGPRRSTRTRPSGEPRRAPRRAARPCRPGGWATCAGRTPSRCAADGPCACWTPRRNAATAGTSPPRSAPRRRCTPRSSRTPRSPTGVPTARSPCTRPRRRSSTCARPSPRAGSSTRHGCRSSPSTSAAGSARRPP